MYACMHVCMYACMHACMCACVHVCMYACMHACMYPCIHVCMYACMYVCIYVCIVSQKKRKHTSTSFENVSLLIIISFLNIYRYTVVSFNALQGSKTCSFAGGAMWCLAMSPFSCASGLARHCALHFMLRILVCIYIYI